SGGQRKGLEGLERNAAKLDSISAGTSGRVVKASANRGRRGFHRGVVQEQAQGTVHPMRSSLRGDDLRPLVFSVQCPATAGRNFSRSDPDKKPKKGQFGALLSAHSPQGCNFGARYLLSRPGLTRAFCLR